MTVSSRITLKCSTGVKVRANISHRPAVVHYAEVLFRRIGPDEYQELEQDQAEALRGYLEETRTKIDDLTLDTVERIIRDLKEAKGSRIIRPGGPLPGRRIITP